MLTHPQQDRCQERKKERMKKVRERKKKKEKKKKKGTVTGGVNLDCDDGGGKELRRAVW